MPTSPDSAASNPARELAAIMFSDVVGYTAIMGRDEHEALRALDAHRELLRALLPKFNGRMVGEIGDGTLTSFHSAIDAVNCAREVQASLQDQPELKVRIGIHLGDVVFSNNTVLGDGVNVASRIHSLAPPGGICVSSNIHDEIRNKPGTRFRDLGEQKLKNVSRPIRVYQIVATDLATQPTAQSGHRGRTALLAGAGAVIFAGLALVLVQLKSQAPTTPQTVSAAKRTISSIAVLPLENLSGDPSQEYFADGMTEELITDLAQISALRVISRTSVMKFKGVQRESLPEIARVLNVDAIVEGSVLRVGDKVRITAQLIDASADRHLWAKSYERDSRDVLTLQDELASAIAREINVELTPQEQTHLARTATVNPEAHEAYLKGRYYLDKQGEQAINQAIAYFQQAIAADSKFAPAYSGLADAYSYGVGLYFPATEMKKARVAAERALQLDETLSEAHASLGFVKYQYDYDWKGSEHEFQRAIELNPGYAEAHHQYGWCLVLQGRMNEALAEMKHASELDPLSFIITVDMAVPWAFEKKLEASAQIRKGLELEPNSSFGRWAQGWVDIEAGRIGDAIPELESARASDSAPYIAGWLGFAYAATGRRAEALKIQEQLNQSSRTNATNAPFFKAIIYLGMGDKDRALENLRKASEARSPWIIQLKVSHIYDALRSDPRFIELLKKLGLNN